MKLICNTHIALSNLIGTRKAINQSDVDHASRGGERSNKSGFYNEHLESATIVRNINSNRDSVKKKIAYHRVNSLSLMKYIEFS